MHELSIAQSILEIVQQNLPPSPSSNVKSVKLRVGEMAGVVPESLEFCFDAITRDTRLAGAVLDIERIPVAAVCENCKRRFVIEQLTFACPLCESSRIEVVSGRELQIVEIELADEKVEAS